MHLTASKAKYFIHSIYSTLQPKATITTSDNELIITGTTIDHETVKEN
jgi:hypothetical protein